MLKILKERENEEVNVLLNIWTSLTLNSDFWKLEKNKEQMWTMNKMKHFKYQSIQVIQWFTIIQLEYFRRILTNTYAENPSPAPSSSDLISLGPV